GWDVSIIEDEFAHNTGESMFERWENSGGKNQRRFFFFHEGRLWKMLVSLDVSILPADKKNFETFQRVMQGQYGAGDVEPGLITWRTDEFHVRALDKLKTYDALALAIEDPRVKQSLVAIREAKAPPKKDGNSVIKAVIDTDKSDHPDVKQNSGAVDAATRHGPIVTIELSEADFEALVSASGLTATSSSRPEIEPWQPPHTASNRSSRTPIDVRSPGPSWCSSPILTMVEPPPSWSSSTTPVFDGSRRRTEPSLASSARPSIMR